MIDKSVYFKNIDILKLLLALTVVVCHLWHFFDDYLASIPFYNFLYTNSRLSHYPVLFFFVISGFFLFNSTNFKKNFYDFFASKIIRMFPVVIFSLLLYFGITCITPLKFNFYENIWTLFGLQNIGLTLSYGDNYPAWFVSTLLWVSSFYFYLYKNVKKEIFNLLTAGIIIFCLSYLIHSKGGSNYINYEYIFNLGCLKGFAGIGIGYFISNLYRDFKDKIISNKITFISTSIIEILCFVFIFNHMIFAKLHYKNNIILLLAFLCLFYCFLIKKGILSKLLENNISVFLGRYSYSIFVVHFIITTSAAHKILPVFQKAYVTLHPYLVLVLIYVAIIFLAVIAHHFIEKPGAKFLSKIFFKQ